jgi:hypothetical protein
MIMMTAASLFALVFVSLLLWLLRPNRHASEGARLPLDQGMDHVLPKHYHFFPQVRQALSAGDVQYLRDAAPPHIAQQALRERRAVARKFLSGLYEDFTKLERLAHMVTALSPVISREQETERLMLSLRFRVLYSLVWMRLSLGRVPLQHIELLTGLVGRLAVRMEQAIAEINALSAEHVPRSLSV